MIHQEAMNLYIHKTIKPHSCKIMWVQFFPLSDLSGWRHTKNNVCLHFGGGRTSRRWVWICQGLELEKGVLFCGFLRCSFFVCCSTSALGLLYYDYYNGCLIITMARERGLPSSLFYDDPFAYISLAVNLIYWLQGVSGQDWKRGQIAYYCNFFDLPSFPQHWENTVLDTFVVVLFHSSFIYTSTFNFFFIADQKYILSLLHFFQIIFSIHELELVD